MAVVAADPREVIVDPTAEQTVSTCFFDDDGAEILVIDVQFVAFAARKNQARVVGGS